MVGIATWRYTLSKINLPVATQEIFQYFTSIAKLLCTIFSSKYEITVRFVSVNEIDHIRYYRL